MWAAERVRGLDTSRHESACPLASGACRVTLYSRDGGPIFNSSHSAVTGSDFEASTSASARAGSLAQHLIAKAYAAEKRLTGARLILIAVNTLIYATVVNKAQTIPSLAYATIGLSWIYALYIYFAEPHRRYQALVWSYFTSTADAILIALWLLATGGAHSPFYLTLYLSMIAISFRYSTRETVFAGALYMLAYGALLFFSGHISENLDFAVVRLVYIPMAAVLGGVISREIYERTAARVKASEQRHAAARIKQSEIRVAQTEEVASLGSWEWEIASNELRWSDQLYRIFAVDPKQFRLTFEEYLARIHPEDCKLVRERLEQSRRDGQPFEFEHRIIRGTGEVRTLATRGHAVVDKAGRAWKLVGTEHDITERKRVEERLHHLANHDALTGLPNRNLLLDRITQALARPPWHHRWVGILFLNIDRLKLVNDSLGHNIGDELLRAVAQRLLGCVREGDTVARVGGDEFAVLLADIAQQEDAGMLAQKVLTRLADPMSLEKHEVFVTASIGVSIFPEDGGDAETLLRNAAASMNRAKEQGKNNYSHYSPSMNSRSVKRLALETSLRRALERDEFVLHYQPIIDLNRQQIVSMEALVRWRNPELGLVSPGEFIPLAEETGLIVPIGEWVLHTACAQNVQWQRGGVNGICVAVNLSARQFHQQNLVDMVGRALHKSDLEPKWLELELTESIMMSNEEASIGTLLALHRMGVRLALDDFGTGYSSLSYLKRFPISTLKIDQAFVRNIDTDPNDRAIAAAIVTLGHSLSLSVLAEAVETAEQLELLRVLRCDQVQGYLFSRPLPAEDATRLLAERQKLIALAAGVKSVPVPASGPGPELAGHS